MAKGKPEKPAPGMYTQGVGLLLGMGSASVQIADAMATLMAEMNANLFFGTVRKNSKLLFDLWYFRGPVSEMITR